MTTGRRQFIKVAAAASASVAITAASARRILGANERIRVGVIGTGGRGQLLMDFFQRSPGAEVAAICDVYEPRAAQAREKLTNGSQVRVYRDYRRVLEEKAIDAVVIAPPDHWHTPMALEAIAAGKDLFLEKPVTHTLDEGPRLLAAVKGSKQVVQTGTQNRSMPHFIEAKALVGSGALGRVALVETYFYQNYLRTDPGRIAVDESKLDWKGFLGGAPDQPFDRLRFQQWRWYWDFGGGALTDLFTHVVDVAHWFLGKDTPRTASAVGSNALIPRWETPDTLSACFAYPEGLVVTFSAMMGGSLQGGGTLFRGTKAMLRISRRGFEVWDEPPQFIGPPTGPPRLEVKAEGDTMMPHVQNFLDCMRSRNTPNAPIEAGIACARAGHLGNMALRQGQKVTHAG
jgi:predicted dehydrogenase